MVSTIDRLKMKRFVRLVHNEDEEFMDVIVLGPDTLTCLSSTTPMLTLGTVRLLYGDRIEVEKLDYDTYRLVSIPAKQDYVHHLYNLGAWGGPADLVSSKKSVRNLAWKNLHDFLREHFTPQPYTDYLHAIGGEWERDDFLGSILMVHLPSELMDEYQCRLPELSPGLAGEGKWITITSGEVDPNENW